MTGNYQHTEQKQNLTGYVDGDVARGVEAYAEERDLSKASAVNDLLSQALSADRWGDQLRKAEELLHDPDVVSFSTAVTYEDGDTQLVSAARGPGYTGENEVLEELVDAVGPQETARMRTVMALLDMIAIQHDRPVSDEAQDLAAVQEAVRGDTVVDEEGRE